MNLPHDLRIAWRALRQAPAFSAVVIVTFALGIGSVTALFTYASALLLRPLPFEQPEQLVRIQPVRGGVAGPISALEVRDIAEQSRLIADVASFKNAQFTVTGEGPPEIAFASFNSYNLFNVLGVRPLLGRTWPATDDGTRQFAVVVSHNFWQGRLGGDAAIVGKSITLDAYGYTVIGVLPAGFNFPTRADVYRRVSGQDLHSRSIRSASAVARLASGVTLEQAQAELDVIAARLAERFPETNAGARLVATPLREYWLGNARTFFAFLVGAVGCVLLIACTNVAGLLLARSAARDREVAVRIAIGAGRGAIVRPTLVESVLFAALGAVGGLLVAHWLVAALDGLMRIDRPTWMALAVDWRVLLVSLGAATVSGLAAGLVPALHTSAVPPADALRAAGRGMSGGAGRHRLLRQLVVVQIALAVVLLAAAGLMTRTLRQLAAIELGFDADQLLTLKIDASWAKYDRVEVTAPFYRRVLDEIATVPGISSVAINDAPPIIGRGEGEGSHKNLPLIEGQPAEAREKNPFVNLQMVSTGYFRAMGIPLGRGRTIEPHDRSLERPVVVVSERLAQTLWPGVDAIGRRLQLGELDGTYNYRMSWTDTVPRWATVVGVVGNVTHDAARTEPGLDLYVSTEQYFTPGSYVLVRGRGTPAQLLESIRQAIWKIDPDIAVFDVATMRQRLDDLFWQRRLSLALLGGFGILALVLAALGVYGVMSFATAQRRTELGVRVALGADRAQVTRLVLGEAARLSATGIGLGLVFALGTAQMMRSLLYEVSPVDPMTLIATAFVIAVAALGAAYIPAMRAARVDPVTAMRQ